jgi:hypothetical protein
VQDKNKPLESIIETARAASDGKDIDLISLVEAFGDRAFGPVMILCSLFLMTPLGAIPGLPAAFGLIVIVFAVQLLFRRDHPWMPQILRKMKISHGKLETVRNKISPWLQKIDRFIGPRLPWVSSAPMQVATALLAILLALLMVPLGAIPFGVVPPAFVLGLLGLGITAHDGLLIVLGFALTVGAAFGVSNLAAGLF